MGLGGTLGSIQGCVRHTESVWQRIGLWRPCGDEWDPGDHMGLRGAHGDHMGWAGPRAPYGAEKDPAVHTGLNGTLGAL